MTIDDYPPYTPSEEAIICQRWFGIDYKLVVPGSVRQTVRNRRDVRFHVRLKGTIEHVTVEGKVGV